MPSLQFASLYIFILGGHFLYAFYLLKAGQVSLALGPVRSRGQILAVLLLINSVSFTVFVYPNESWILVNMVYHAALALFELAMVTKSRGRWPFFINHLCFIWVLELFRGTLIGTQ